MGKMTSCNISQLLADSIPKDSGQKAKEKRNVGTKKTSKQVEIDSIEENPRLLVTSPTHKSLNAGENLPASLLSATCTSPNSSFNQPV